MSTRTLNRSTADLTNLSTKLPAEIHTALQTIADYVSTAPPKPGVDHIRTRQSVESLVAALNAVAA